ncbi:MAG: 5'-3' exonuclease H3TH domain-containing protein [Buchnera aphidicola (Chaetogeoica yunlongensis)]
MNINEKKINYLLIDGTAYLYRAYYTFPTLKNNLNKPCGAIFGVINMVKKILLKYPYTKIIIAFDSPQKTFRNKIFLPYKKNRNKMPIKLKQQIMPLFYTIKNIGIPIISIPTFEADDIIGTLAKKLYTQNKSILISTYDKDFAQLVNSHINILVGTSDIILDETKVKQKYGVIPKLIPDLLGLSGDSSDNIPGVPKIGKKTALYLIKNFGSLNKIYENIEKISKYPIRNSKLIHKQLKNYKNLALLSKKLATIKTNISKKLIIIDKLTMLPPSIKKLSYIFKYYNFQRLLKLLEKGIWLKSIKNIQ